MSRATFISEGRFSARQIEKRSHRIKAVWVSPDSFHSGFIDEQRFMASWKQ